MVLQVMTQHMISIGVLGLVCINSLEEVWAFPRQ